MKEVDENLDGEVDFQEYIFQVGRLTAATNFFFTDFDKFYESLAEEDRV